MLEVNNLSIKDIKGNRFLVKDLSFVVNPGDKVAIIGEEGNGKTTLLRAIFKDEKINDTFEITGSIKTKGKIKFLRQFFSEEWLNESVESFFLKENPSDEIKFENYNKYGEYLKHLSNLGLNDDILSSRKLIKNLSGGEKVKIRLAKILSNNADILILDEPTNDIDIDTLKFLENFINETNVPILFVSHDETLLENTANAVIHLEQINRKTKARSTFSKLSYEDYIHERLNYIDKENQKHYNEKRDRLSQERKVAEIKKLIQEQNPERQNAMRQAISTERRLADNLITEYYDSEESINVFFDENTNVPNNKVIIDLENYSLELKNGKIIDKINFKVTGSKHIVIFGENGSGKTSFLKSIYEQLKGDSSLNVGYMPQDYEDIFQKYKTAIDFLSDGNKNHSLSYIRTLMGRMKFTPEEQTSKLKFISGGQKAKLYIIKMILEKNNVLILDEPTRNLSPLSNPVIRNMLKNFKGTIISVSHDRKYINEVGEEKYILENQEFKKVDEYVREKRI